jgi:hypothetical protein
MQTVKGKIKGFSFAHLASLGKKLRAEEEKEAIAKTWDRLLAKQSGRKQKSRF